MIVACDLYCSQMAGGDRNGLKRLKTAPRVPAVGKYLRLGTQPLRHLIIRLKND